MDTDRARAIVMEVKADLQDLDAPLVAQDIFQAARVRFGEMKYATEVAKMLASWHLRHVELSLVVCESFLLERKTTGFVAVRPIFETAMTLTWILTASEEAEGQYPNLLTLLDREAVELAVRLQSRKPRVAQRAKEAFENRDEDGRQVVEEAISVGSRRLPSLRTRIAETEEVFREMLGGPSRLADAYEYYRVLSGYGHPTGDGDPYELDKEGNLRERQHAMGPLVPMVILLREMPLLIWVLAYVSDWERGVAIGKGMDAGWFSAGQKFLESYRGILPEPALRIWGWRGPASDTRLKA